MNVSSPVDRRLVFDRFIIPMGEGSAQQRLGEGGRQISKETTRQRSDEIARHILGK